MRKLQIATTVIGGAVASLVLTAVPASAAHTHVRLLGNDSCVVLAPDGGEGEVELPHYEHVAADRRHPLHVKVHLGVAGTRDGEEVVWVQGSAGDLANCDGYVGS